MPIQIDNVTYYSSTELIGAFECVAPNALAVAE